MASRSAGQVTLRGRFPVGAVVTLTRVAGEHVLRPEGGEEVEVQTVGEEKDAPGSGTSASRRAWRSAPGTSSTVWSTAGRSRCV
jgi:hypothetical protein